MSDFSSATLRKLARKGIRVIGLQAIPSEGALPFANASRGYRIDDNGCGRVWTFAQVQEASRV
jgi:nitrous oxide reductase accessory protein NosL